MRRFLLVFLSILTLSLFSFGTTYYVSQADGNDSYNGLYPTYISGTDGPWLTIAKAVTVLTAGDTVYIRTGTYEERVQLGDGVSGTDGNPIIYRNYTGESPVLDGTSFGWGYGFMSGVNCTVKTPRNYIVINGFEIRNYPEYAIGFERNQASEDGCIGSNNITITNCTIHDNVGGIFMEGGDVATPANVGWGHLVTLNTVYNTSAGHNIKLTGDETAGTLDRKQIRDSEISWNICHHSTGTEGSGEMGIHISTGNHNILIAHNTCYANNGPGISTYEAWNITIEHNIVYGNGLDTESWDRHGITCWKPSNIIIRYNLVYDHPRSGIIIDGNMGGSPTACSIYYNIILENGTVTGGDSAGILLYNALAHNVYNNTLYNNHDSQIYALTAVNHQIKNNILYSASGGRTADYLIRVDVTAGWTANKIDYNCYYTTDLTNPWYWGATKATFALWKSASSMDTNGKNEDPKFVNAGGTTAADYKLLLNSPCRGKGANVSLTLDYLGNIVPTWTGKLPDIGAYENRPHGVVVR